jgi:ribose transport system substrate-binding protein
MATGLLDSMLERVRNGQLSRREFFRATGGILGASAAAYLLRSVGVDVSGIPEAKAAPPIQVGEQRPEDWKRMMYFDCTPFKKDPPWKIANLSQGPTNSWALMLDGHSEYAVKDKYKGLFSDYFLVDGQGNAAVQVAAMESLLAQQPDVIISTPLGAALKGPLERAWDMGIPVIQMQMPYLTDKFLSYINGDNYINGYTLARWLAEKLGGKGKIVMSSGIAGVDTAEQRLKGAKDCFAKYPDIEILAQAYHNWSVTEARKGFEAWIAAFPQFDGIWSDSGFAAMAAMDALSEAKRDIPPLTGDMFNGFLRAVKRFNVDFYAYGYTNATGLLMVDMAVRALMGERVERYEAVSQIEFGTDELDKYFEADKTDDFLVDYRYPRAWADKQFPKT